MKCEICGNDFQELEECVQCERKVCSNDYDYTLEMCLLCQEEAEYYMEDEGLL